MVRSGKGASLDFTLPVGLAAFDRQEKSTIVNVLLAAFHVLLAKKTGVHDISIGVPVAPVLTSTPKT
jgi:hypothetical protein